MKSKIVFAGKVGNDPFGQFLIQTLREVKVNTDLIVRDSSALTTMAYVSLQKDGERDFVFSRGADGDFGLQDVPLHKLNEAAVVHFGSATAMLGGTYLEAYFELMGKARQARQFVSFDPNYRGSLWGDRTEVFIRLAKKGISAADFVKVLLQLSRLTHQAIGSLTFADWQDIIHFANQVGAIVCTKVGAIAALPTYEEVTNWDQ